MRFDSICRGPELITEDGGRTDIGVDGGHGDCGGCPVRADTSGWNVCGDVVTVTSLARHSADGYSVAVVVDS